MLNSFIMCVYVNTQDYTNLLIMFVYGEDTGIRVGIDKKKILTF